jgi:cytochrome bd-type quinol oxidase subunit 2
MTDSLVAGWDNFYVITGSSAGGLTGLTFVVIALASDAKRANFRGLRAYVTPIIVHFGAVLALSAYLSMPHQGALSLSLALGVLGVAGLAYVAFIAANIGRISTEYVPVREDWIWNAILPALVYGILLAAAFLIWRRPEPCMYAIAAASLLLMFIGIHNAWDIAVWNTTRKQTDSP